MLVTFTCNAYENIIYFGDVAARLLTLMGHSGTIPGAIKAEHIGEALERLQAGIGRSVTNDSSSQSNDEEENEPDISLVNRAIPLINMLKAAKKANCDILWSS